MVWYGTIPYHSTGVCRSKCEPTSTPCTLLPYTIPYYPTYPTHNKTVGFAFGSPVKISIKTDWLFKNLNFYLFSNEFLLWSSSLRKNKKEVHHRLFHPATNNSNKHHREVLLLSVVVVGILTGIPKQSCEMGCGQSKAAAAVVSTKETRAVSRKFLRMNANNISVALLFRLTFCVASRFYSWTICSSSSLSAPKAAQAGNDQHSTHSSTQKPSQKSNNGQTTAAAPQITPTSVSRPKTTAERRNEFAIRPGYSSGASSYASSYDGSVGGDDLEDGDLKVSRHSDILALSDLRQEMVAEGDLTKCVVRIEVRGLKAIVANRKEHRLLNCWSFFICRVRLVNQLKRSTTVYMMVQCWVRVCPELFDL